MFDIANVPFEHVSESEKQEYLAAIKTNGSYQGYKPREYFVCSILSDTGICGVSDAMIQHIDNGVRDQVELYSSKFFLCLWKTSFSWIRS